MQEFYPLPKFGDGYTLIGSWLINDQPAGIGIREDRALITGSVALLSAHFRRIMSRSGDDTAAGAQSIRRQTTTDSILNEPISMPSTGVEIASTPSHAPGRITAAGNAPPLGWRANPLHVRGVVNQRVLIVRPCHCKFAFT